MINSNQIEIVVGVLTPLGGVGVWLLSVVRDPWRKFNDMLEDWRGEEPRPGYSGRPGVMVRLERLEARGLAHTDDEIRAIAEELLQRQISSNKIMGNKLDQIHQEINNHE